MKIKRFISKILESNGYVIFSGRGGSCYLIDPAAKNTKFLDFIEENELQLKGILLTHNHYDHIAAVKKLVAKTNCPVYIHNSDLPDFRYEAIPFEDGAAFDLDGETITAVNTPGHTRGSVCYVCPESNCVFTGDTVFVIDLGRTDLPEGSPQEMKNTIRNIVSRWDDDVVIYPGHGESGTMKRVREINTEYKEALE
jgi:hydroxyacylglutathione hydrolase